MPKQPSKTSQTQGQQPEPAQIKAVERLIGTRDFPRASERARALVERFPNHSAANRLLVDAFFQAGNGPAAALAAYQWAQRRPNSLTAQRALFQLALEGEHLVLAYRTALRLGELDPNAAGHPLSAEGLEEMLLQPDGSQAIQEDLEWFDIGKLHLNAHDFAGAARVLDGVPITPARNNRALALFHLGRIDEALSGFLGAWEQDPGNLFALGFALQLRLYRGDETGARGLAVPLAQTTARRTEDAEGQLAALLLIQDAQAAWEAFARTEQAPWVKDGTDTLAGLRLHLGAAAASRLGYGDRARTLWKQALKRHPGLTTARDNLAALQRDGVSPAYPALFDLTQLLPINALAAVRAADPASVEHRIDQWRISDAYLEAIYLTGDPMARSFSAHLLRHRLDHAGPQVSEPNPRRAATILRDLAQLPIGTTQERLGFLVALQKRRLLKSDETPKLWNGQELREMRMFATEIDRNPEPSDLPADLQALLEHSLRSFRAGRLEVTETGLNAILARVPDHQTALGNLAGLRARQGRDQECRDLLRRFIAVHPDYLFARVNLAGLLIEDGELDAAKALLEGLAQRPQLHIQEVFALYGVLAMLSRAQGKDQDAADLIASLEGLVEDADDARLLVNAKARVARAPRVGARR